MATLVKFVIDKSGFFEVTAVFPQLKYNKMAYGNDMVTCYSSCGQHSSASINWVKKGTRKATESEYLPLKRELESIGYTLKICK